jgi:hypothetical protein
MVAAVEGPWTSAETSSSGQVFEFRLWATLIEQSRGSLHVFLPPTDRGIDALVHRRTDGTYLSVQAKGRSSLDGGEVHLVVWADSLQDDGALLVSGLIVDGGLGPTMLVVPEGQFKELAEQSTNRGRPIYAMRFGMRPLSTSRWLPFLIPTGRLVERFGVVPSAPGFDQVPESHPMWRSDLGFLGESELVRLLAEAPDLNLFRPFPDLETAELAVLDLNTRRTVGLQVKTIGVDSGHPSATVSVYASSFRPDASTYVVVMAWKREGDQFHEECLLIPSGHIRDIARPDTASGYLKFDWHPGSASQSHLDTYRTPLNDLRRRVELKIAAV